MDIRSRSRPSWSGKLSRHSKAFNVDDYKQFALRAKKPAVRVLATMHPYDAHDDTSVSLRHSVGED